MSAAPQTTPRRPVGTWFWGGFVAVILFGFLLALAAFVRGGGSWLDTKVAESETLPPAWRQAIRVTLSGEETLLLDPETLESVREESRRWLATRERAVREELDAFVVAESRRAMGGARRYVPAFADWHYSLAGEYSRLYHALAGDLGPFITTRVNDLILHPAGTAEALETLGKDLDAAISSRLQSAVLELETFIGTLVRRHGMDSTDGAVRVDGEWDLGAALEDDLTPLAEFSARDAGRRGVAAGAGAATAVMAAKKIGAATAGKLAGSLGVKTSAGALGAALGKLGLKSAAKSGGALGAAGGGAAAGGALCAGTIAGAPLAPGCALVGGAVSGLAAWLLVDKAVLEADELLHRDELETRLRETLAAEAESLEARLLAHTGAAVGAAFERLATVLGTGITPDAPAPSKDFVPAAAARAG